MYRFQNRGDGAIVHAGLIADRNGNLFGTTVGLSLDGYCQKGCGTVFEMMLPGTKGGAWTFSVLYAFTMQNGDEHSREAGWFWMPSATCMEPQAEVVQISGSANTTDAARL